MYTLGVVAICISIAKAQTPTGAKEMFSGGGDSSVVAYSGKKEKPKPSTPKRDEHDSEASQAATELQHSCGLSFSIELVAPGKPGIQVSQTRAFRSGERIRLHFKTNTGGNLSIVQLGSSGTSATLFPDSASGLTNNSMSAGVDHILPSEKHWFRFDDSAGTEKLLVFFAKEQSTLDRALPIQPVMNQIQTAELMSVTKSVVGGSKDLLIETADDATYAVSKNCDIVAMEIQLRHR
jgi:hypothetical protein